MADSGLVTVMVWLFIIGFVIYAIGGLAAIIGGWASAMRALSKDQPRKARTPDRPRTHNNPTGPGTPAPQRQDDPNLPQTAPSLPSDSPTLDAWEGVKRIRTRAHQSWSNICKAVLALQEKPHPQFGTPNVEASSKSTVRRILRETGLSLAQLEWLLKKQAVWK